MTNEPDSHTHPEDCFGPKGEPLVAGRPTAAERLNRAVYRHGILWTELSARVVKDSDLTKDEADDQVCALIERRSVSLPVAVALIEMIVERQSPK